MKILLKLKTNKSLKLLSIFCLISCLNFFANAEDMIESSIPPSSDFTVENSSLNASLESTDSENPIKSGTEKKHDENNQYLHKNQEKKLSETIITKHVFSLIGKPKYPDNFTHFEYVNPDAPKGGELKLAEIGRYDNFNTYASRGVPEHNVSDLINESLFIQSDDELSSYYPLLASSIKYSTKYQWAEVTLNTNAHFSDGEPVTAEDVEFTFYKFMIEGVPQYRSYYSGVTVKAIDKSHVRFELPEPNREQLLTFVGDFKVLPKHFWLDKDLAEPLNTPPIGSGPYILTDYKMGQYAIYHRDLNYWAKDLPVNKGRYNFDVQRFDYYFDNSVALEAFKAGEFDFRLEPQPKNWFTQYQGERFDKKLIIKKEDELTTSVNTTWLAFNLSRSIFSNIKVRKALTLSFDFAWFNHAFFYDSFQQPNSFFVNTPYAAKGRPSDLELKWLDKYKGKVPDAVFNDAYSVPKSNQSGFNRDNLREAKQLLEEAGWVIKDNQLVNQETGQPFEFELLTYIGSDTRYVIAFKKMLAKLGIKMTITSVDTTQFLSRMRSRDYDMVPRSYNAFSYPSSDLKVFWGSNYLNSSWNASGLHNDSIDDLLDQIPNYVEDEKNLIAIGRSLDRILTQEYPMIPMWYPNSINYAYWNKFSQPTIKPPYVIAISTWWYDKQKAEKLSKIATKNKE